MAILLSLLHLVLIHALALLLLGPLLGLVMLHLEHPLLLHVLLLVLEEQLLLIMALELCFAGIRWRSWRASCPSPFRRPRRRRAPLGQACL